MISSRTQGPQPRVAPPKQPCTGLSPVTPTLAIPGRRGQQFAVLNKGGGARRGVPLPPTSPASPAEGRSRKGPGAGCSRPGPRSRLRHTSLGPTPSAPPAPPRSQGWENAPFCPAPTLREPQPLIQQRQGLGGQTGRPPPPHSRPLRVSRATSRRPWAAPSRPPPIPEQRTAVWTCPEPARLEPPPSDSPGPAGSLRTLGAGRRAGRGLDRVQEEKVPTRPPAEASSRLRPAPAAAAAAPPPDTLQGCRAAGPRGRGTAAGALPASLGRTSHQVQSWRGMGRAS